MDDGDFFVGTLALLFGLFVYLLPWTVGRNRFIWNIRALFWFNLLLGWTGWCWIAAMWWAFTAPQDKPGAFAIPVRIVDPVPVYAAPQAYQTAAFTHAPEPEPAAPAEIYAAPLLQQSALRAGTRWKISGET